MKQLQACGIVVEYNPLHTGHIHHIKESRRQSGCDVLIAVMSPYFVQRGDIAIVSPAHRAQSAIQHGVDIVVELPYPYCSEHADKFAQGAIQVLSYMHIDSLCFGSESNDIEALKQQLLQMLTTQPSIPQKTLSMAAANYSDHSNDILGLAYLKALQNTTIKPLTIQRTNTYRSEQITTQHASASALRRSFYDNKDSDIHAYTPLHEVIRQHHLPSLASHYQTIRYLLCTQPVEYLKSMFLMDEGIEGLLIKQAQQHHNYDDFLYACTSKRYTKSRITRTLTHLLLQTTKARALQLEQLQFVRILALNEQGQEYLKQLRAIRKEEVNSHDPKTIQPIIVNRFNQLPHLYQEETMKHLHVVYAPTNKKRFETALQEELSYPILCKTADEKQQ